MSIIPKKIKIYYAYPSSLNYPTNNYNLDSVANDFAQYDIIILGNNLDSSSHQDHNNTITIMNKPILSNTEFCGYVRTGDSLNISKTKIDNWKSMSNRITTIFCGEFGFDYGITRNKQNNLVDYIHSKGLKVMANSWNPSDIFDGTPAHKLNNNDWILLESYQIINDQYRSKEDWRERANKAIGYKQTDGIKVACITTSLVNTYDQNKWDYAYYSSVIDNFDAIGYGEKDYSASTSLMPYRPEPIVYGTEYRSNIIEDPNDIFKRKTNVGVQVDTNLHVAKYLLN